MKSISSSALITLALSLSPLYGQMPSSFDASGQSAKADSGVQGDPNMAGEPTNPQLFGMEIPLLDPGSDTATYNGAKFDVGNNAAVRARFEKYLQQAPDDTKEAKRYRAGIAKILKTAQESTRKGSPKVGSDALVKIGKALYELADYDMDANQCAILANAILSAIDAQRGNLKREKENAETDAEIKKLIKETNTKMNRNATRETVASGAGGSVGGVQAPSSNRKPSPYDTFLISSNAKDIAVKEAQKVAKDTKSGVVLMEAKTHYQALIFGLLFQRRFDHAVIATRIYRHVFKDGDSKINLKEDSDASKMFSDVAGVPPTVNTMDSLASTARRDVDQSIQAVHSLLAQNKLADATQHLIQAVALGEFMQSVTTFPQKDRLRIAQYWSLRKRVLNALNSRDYGTAEEMAIEMKRQDIDFDDSMIMSFCAGKKRQSDLCIRNAMKALQDGNQEEFTTQVTNAGIIWPRNPNLDEAQKKLLELDNHDPTKVEFSRLLAREEYRTIFNEQDRFEVVAIDPELKNQYKDVIAFIATTDAMLTQLNAVAKQDRRLGPCAAYETMHEKLKEDPRFGKDSQFKDALARYTKDAHNFVSTMDEARTNEKKGEYGSALASYYRALSLYPQSNEAANGAKRLAELVMSAKY